MEDPLSQEKDQQRALVDRLRRIEGQVRGLQRMIEEGRECEDILPQLSAVISATKRVATLLALCSMTQRLRRAIEDGSDPHSAVADLLELLSRLP